MARLRPAQGMARHSNMPRCQGPGVLRPRQPMEAPGRTASTAVSAASRRRLHPTLEPVLTASQEAAVLGPGGGTGAGGDRPAVSAEAWAPAVWAQAPAAVAQAQARVWAAPACPVEVPAGPELVAGGAPEVRAAGGAGRAGMPGMGGAAGGGAKGAGAKGAGAARAARWHGRRAVSSAARVARPEPQGREDPVCTAAVAAPSQGATGGRRPAGMAGAHGAHGAKGKDKGGENGQRPDYLVEDEETWTPERNVAPKVIE